MSKKKTRLDLEFDDFVRRENIRLKGIEAELEIKKVEVEFELKKQQRIAEAIALIKKHKDDKDDQ